MPRVGGRKLYWLLKPKFEQLEESIGRDKFFDLLRRNKLLVKRKKRYARTTNSYHRFHKHRNLIKHIKITGPNKVYASDITYMRVKGRFIYLALITDMYSRKIVGWNLSDSLAIEGAVKALKMALRQCPDPSELIHHSDRGIQYCSHAYTGILESNNVRISMTEENHCYENALAERVNGILKDEFLLDQEFKEEKIAYKAVKQAIKNYNGYRPHQSLEYFTPDMVHKAVFID
jgi:putative transposase